METFGAVVEDPDRTGKFWTKGNSFAAQKPSQQAQCSHFPPDNSLDCLFVKLGLPGAIWTIDESLDVSAIRCVFFGVLVQRFMIVLLPSPSLPQFQSLRCEPPRAQPSDTTCYGPWWIFIRTALNPPFKREGRGFPASVHRYASVVGLPWVGEIKNVPKA